MKKNYTISIGKETFWKILLPSTIILMIISGIAGVFCIDRFIMPNLPGIDNRGIVKIPSIIDMSYNDAKQVLYNIGLRLQIKEKEYSDQLPENHIINQEPPPKKRVKKGRHVFVVVSKGIEIDTIPDIRKLSEGAGKTLLRKSGFHNIEVIKAYSEYYDKDAIVRTIPEHGTIISREIDVNVVISKGPQPTHAEVPNVIGEMLSEAKMKIKERGLLVGKVEHRKHIATRPGSVISQSVSPGTHAPFESYINLVVSASK